jgi:transcriptional regulator with XRE-family HTH domain
VTEVSTRLRAARERAGLTIEDVAASTKIRAASLEALERGDFSSLPGEFYTRAFLRSYAAHLGLSPQAILADYESEQPQAQAPPAEPAAQRPLRSLLSPLLAAATSTGVVIALVVALLALAVANRSDTPPAAEPGAVGTSGNGAGPAPAKSTGAPAAAPESLIIDIQAAAPLWVTGAADGRRVLYRLLAPGERVTVKAAESFAFRVGDASAFTYSINGVPGKALGGAGEVRDVEITRDNYRSFAR